MPTPSKLGDLLLRAKLIDDRQLETALDYQNARGGKLGEILVSLGYVSEAELLKLLSAQLSLPLIGEAEVLEMAIDVDTRNALPRFLAEEELIFPLSTDRERKLITVVTHEPLDDATLDGIRIFANVEHVKTFLTTKAAMRKMLAKHLPQKPGPTSSPQQAQMGQPVTKGTAAEAQATPSAAPTAQPPPPLPPPVAVAEPPPSPHVTAQFSTLPMMSRVAAPQSSPPKAAPLPAHPAPGSAAALFELEKSSEAPDELMFEAAKTPSPQAAAASAPGQITGWDDAPPTKASPAPPPPLPPLSAAHSAPPPLGGGPSDVASGTHQHRTMIGIPSPYATPPPLPPDSTAGSPPAQSTPLGATQLGIGGALRAAANSAPSEGRRAEGTAPGFAAVSSGRVGTSTSPGMQPVTEPGAALGPTLERAAATAPRLAPRPGTSRRVLLVDHDAPFRETVADLLTRQGHQVVQAETAREVAVQRDFICDDLVIREPDSADAHVLAQSLRRLNPYLDVRNILSMRGALAGSTIDPTRLFAFFFELWDMSLRALDPATDQERRKARARADLAHDLGIELAFDARAIEEVFLQSYLVGLGSVAARLGFGGAGENPVEAMLRQTRCPFDLGELLAPVPAVPPPDGRGSPKVRVAAAAASLIAQVTPGLGAKELLERLTWAGESPDLAMAALRTLTRRGEIAMPGSDGREVVVVDTDVRHAGELWMRFIGDGFGARFFHDGKTAMEYLFQRPATVVITEVELPGVDGVALCTALKANAETRDTKVFFVSRQADASVIMRGLAAGAEDYLIKPANLDLLLIKARRVLGR